MKTRPIKMPSEALPVRVETAGTATHSTNGLEAHESAIHKLAMLSPVEYDKQRSAEAKRLGIRTTTLDAEVAKMRPAEAISGLQGSAVDLADVEPWPEPVDGAELLNAVAQTFERYLALPDGAADGLTLWAVHAHIFEAFVCTPRLNISSPEKGCGKTTLLDVLTLLVPRPIKTENLTTAVLFRLIEAHRPTVLADECDAWLHDNEELRGLLNAGHRSGAMAYRCEGDNNTVRGFHVFAPAVLAGIGALPGTLHDRSIVIRLERAKPGELKERFDSRRTQLEHELRRKLARWTADNAARLETCDPTIPKSAANRLADNWRPLFAVAEIAGGDWPQRAAVAFAKLTAKADMDAEGIGTMLLADIRDIFERTEADPFPSADLATALAEIEYRPWPEYSHGKPITTAKLSRMLKRFQIVSGTKRNGADTFKGYDRHSFNDAFARYLNSRDRVTTSQPA